MRRLVDLTYTNARTEDPAGPLPLIVRASQDISDVPPDRLVTLAAVVDLAVLAEEGIIASRDLAKAGLAGYGGCILATGWHDDHIRGIPGQPPVLGVDAASTILSAGLRTVAADFPLKGAGADLLLANGCVLVHCLSNTNELNQPVVRLAALPLKLTRVRSADARVIAIEE